MIEAEDVRIYIDPIELPDNYTDCPAGIILITHDHGDQYDSSSLSIICINETVFIFPNNMTEEFENWDEQFVTERNIERD